MEEIFAYGFRNPFRFSMDAQTGIVAAPVRGAERGRWIAVAGIAAGVVLVGRLGLALGRGVERDQAVADIGQAVEGLHTAKELDALADRCGVEMPITRQVKRVLFDAEPPVSAVDALLARDAKPELL